MNGRHDGGRHENGRHEPDRDVWTVVAALAAIYAAVLTPLAIWTWG